MRLQIIKSPLCFVYLIIATSFPLLAIADKPNVLILYADDLGYGDLECYNANSKIPTPNLNQLARQGMKFMDAHSSSGICTPSRYAMLTGRYHWRKFHGIVNALGGSVFDQQRLTLPEMLQQNGYDTACIGKWHLGWDWDAIKLPGAQPTEFEQPNGNKRKYWSYDSFDWSKPIPDGPLDHGFDHYFGDTVINFPPYAWIRDRNVIEAPDSNLTITQKTKEGGWEARPGPARSDWDFYRNLPTLTEQAVQWIQGRERNETPFMLYFPLPSPHAPIVPTDEFDGKSNAGPYGDYVTQTDWSCGQLLNALRSAGFDKNTLVVFTADNGPERYAYARDEKFDHWSSTPLRGLKRDIYEGGHRVPFIVRWPGVVSPASSSDQLVSQIDLMATIASIIGFRLPPDAAEDSHDLLPVIKQQKTVRQAHVHNTRQNQYAIRYNDWLLIDHQNGYMSRVSQKWHDKHGYSDDSHASGQLFKLNEDLGQHNNRIDDYPEKAKELRKMLQQIRDQGYSAPRLSR